ncbi:MAG TPA: response regulator transcription factor [Acidimicrobiales bacterium]|nr:response regulator transcription factor [Acidimicrobiales bacterium]
MAATVLVVEDEVKIRELVRGYLERAGLSVVTTGSGAEALTLHDEVHPDLVVLDLRLPDVAGETVAAEIRRQAATPIVMLTAKASEADRIAGLELGADDYLTKPFSPRELVLRVQAVLRRTSSPAAAGGAVSFGGGEVVVDADRREVTVRGTAVELTATEWAILEALASAPGRVFSRFELVNRARGYEFDGYERTVDSHVKNVRRKLEADPSHPRIVTTVVGTGYRFGLRRDP